MLPLNDSALDARRRELIGKCRDEQGEYLDGHHPPSSWATTYSDEFIAAVTVLVQVYREAKVVWGPVYCISHDLQEAGILSCRGSPMTMRNTQYLWDTHIARRVKKHL